MAKKQMDLEECIEITKLKRTLESIVAMANHTLDEIGGRIELRVSRTEEADQKATGRGKPGKEKGPQPDP